MHNTRTRRISSYLWCTIGIATFVWLFGDGRSRGLQALLGGELSCFNPFFRRNVHCWGQQRALTYGQVIAFVGRVTHLTCWAWGSAMRAQDNAALARPFAPAATDRRG